MLRSLWYYPILLLMLLLAGCDRGPGPEVLQQDLQDRLDSHFHEDLFAVHTFKRIGSAPFSDIESGVSGVFVYYDAELQFRQDYSLAQWRGLNLGTLAFAIGATEAGVAGFQSGGNSRGDLLRVHGRFAYAPGDKGAGDTRGWVALDKKAKAPPPGHVDAVPAQHGRGPALVLEDARALLAVAPDTTLNSHNKVIVEELGNSVNRIDIRLARLDNKMTLGTGPVSGTYYSFGKALSRYAEQQGVGMFGAESVGSVDNATRLQAGKLDFGLVQSDVAALLHQGILSQGLFPSTDLRAVASLWPEAVHLLTLEGSGINSVYDLSQRRIAIGKRGSGSRINAVLIAMAALDQIEDIPIALEIDLAKAIRQMERGEIDALFLTEAVPAPAIQALAARRSDLRFISLPDAVLQRLTFKHFSYYPLTVAARTYPGQTEPFTTLGLAAAMMTNVHEPDGNVESMLDLLLSGDDALARRDYRAAFITLATMQLALEVPLHPAAERFYRRHAEASVKELGADTEVP